MQKFLTENKKAKKTVLYALCAVVLGAAILFGGASSSSGSGCADHSLLGWAWSENTGWISFSCKNTTSTVDYGVDKSPSTGLLSGKAWSEYMGWISFDSADLAGCPSGTCTAVLSTTTNAASGWARVLAASSSASGWDGWIKLNGTASDSTPYGVFLNSSTKELYGWAWGGNTANGTSTGVVGWVSFNCSNRSSCGTIAYKVQSPVQPPTISSLSAPTNTSDNYCSCWLDGSDQKQVGRSGSVGFSWLYQDPGASPLASYQLKVSETNDVNGATSTYMNPTGLNVAAGSQVDSGTVNVVSSPGAGELAYNKTYYWWVNACNAGGACTNWIAGSSFSTPQKRYPITGIGWTGKDITASEEVQFCTSANVNDPADPCYSTCYKGTASPAVPDDPKKTGTEWVCSACFDSSNNYRACQDVSGTLYNWILPGTEGTDYSFVSSTTASSPNPIVKFITPGKNRTIKLRVSGSSCGDETTTDILLPNPIWREKNPF